MIDIHTLAAEKGLILSSFRMQQEHLYFVKSLHNELLFDGHSMTREELEAILIEYPSPGKGADHAK